MTDLKNFFTNRGPLLARKNAETPNGTIQWSENKSSSSQGAHLKCAPCDEDGMAVGNARGNLTNLSVMTKIY